LIAELVVSQSPRLTEILVVSIIFVLVSIYEFKLTCYGENPIEN